MAYSETPYNEDPITREYPLYEDYGPEDTLWKRIQEMNANLLKYGKTVPPRGAPARGGGIPLWSFGSGGQALPPNIITVTPGLVTPSAGAGVALGAAPAVAPGANWMAAMGLNMKDLINAGASAAGAAQSYAAGSGQRKILKKILEEYNRTLPGRMAVETGYANRLPTHVKANFTGMDPLSQSVRQSSANFAKFNYPQYPG